MPSLPSTISYDQYMARITDLVASGQTSGPVQSDALIKYTRLNLKRMQRLNKTVNPGKELLKAVNQVPTPMRWIAITEAWCGDAAQNLPFIARLAELSPNVTLGLVWRDEHLEYMNQHLTNGSKAIPKLIIYREDTLAELGKWGPRPEPPQRRVLQFVREAKPGESYETVADEIHTWYSRDKNATLEAELLQLFTSGIRL